MQNRRQFLQHSALVSLTPAIPTFLANTAFGAPQRHDGRILVVIQLDGGNDGINTVVPFRDEGYAKYRDKLRIPTKDSIKLTDDLAFHPRLRSAAELFEDNRLSIVSGVGYPNPNRSHFKSMGIWHAASVDKADRNLGDGWLGHAIGLEGVSQGPHAIHIGTDDLPLALRGRRCTATTVSNSADLQLTLKDLKVATPSTVTADSLADYVTKSVSEAFASAKELSEYTKEGNASPYPGSKLGQRLKLVGQLIKSDASARVYYTSHGGFDTHASQPGTHANLLGEFSSSLKAFMNDMRDIGIEDRVLVMAFSEFGRRVEENASLGTDHGTAGPMILAGTRLTRREYGKLPSLTDLENGDLKYTTDFRDIYAAVLTDWLGFKLPEPLADFGQQGVFKV